MKKEDKELLLKDLCARLPYGVIMQMNNRNYLPTKLSSVNVDTCKLEIGTIHDVPIDCCKPYLRPMSSMTEDEKKIYKTLLSERNLYGGLGIKIIDWLNAHHFDYRGLIEKSLALEAPKDMYNIK